MSIVSSDALNLSIPIEKITYNEQGLVPAIAQDYLDGTILMMAWMNAESIKKTLETGEAWYWSRSRQEYWHKGATSGHIQKIKTIRYDCDSDVLLLNIDQVGNVACHTGERSCFHQINGQKIDPPGDTLTELYKTICDRRDNPTKNSYTCSLFEGGDNKILKKIGEESAEVVMACKDNNPEEIVGEVSDLFYHALVALAYHQVDLREVYKKLQQRRQ